jgi:ubiquinone/menaquinone biosynthesis C-methylase UbiE
LEKDSMNDFAIQEEQRESSASSIPYDKGWGSWAELMLRCPLHPNEHPLTRIGERGRVRTSATDDLVALQCRTCGRTYSVLGGMPNLAVCPVPDDDSFEAEARQWDEHAPIYEEKRWQDALYMAGVDAAVDALGATQGELILDAGCGTGLTVRKYLGPGMRVVALDLSAGSLERLRSSLPDTAAVVPVRANLLALPFADGIFDRVLCANAIQHIPGEALRRQCVQELSRVTRPGGRVVVTAHNLSISKRRAGWPKEGRAGSLSGGVRYIYRYESAEFRAILASAMAVERITGAGLPLPYRWKLSSLSSTLERFLRRFAASSAWANMLVAVCRAGHRTPR